MASAGGGVYSMACAVRAGFDCSLEAVCASPSGLDVWVVRQWVVQLNCLKQLASICHAYVKFINAKMLILLGASFKSEGFVNALLHAANIKVASFL